MRAPDGARSPRWALGGLTLALVWLAWGVTELLPQPGLDPSWLAGLYMARAEGLQFGSDVIFTYGPFGFLIAPRLYYSELAVVAFAYHWVFNLALAGTLLFVARKNFGPWWGIAVAYVGLRAAAFTGDTGYAELLLVLAFVVAIQSLRVIRTDRHAYLFCTIAGVVASSALLLKFSVGVGVIAVTAPVAFVLHRRRWLGLATFLGAFALTFATSWLATGQALGGIGRFLSGSFQIAQGYSEAMGLEQTGLGWEIPAAAAATVVFLATAWRVVRDWDRRYKWAGGLISLLFVGVIFKQGFVRHDDYHSPLFFIAILIACITLHPSVRKELGVAVLLLLTLFTLRSVNVSLAVFLDPRPSVSGLTADIADLARSSTRSALVDGARAGLQSYYQLDPNTVAAISGRTIHVHPWEATVAWAYPEAVWRPLPIMQAYSVYTAELDQTNADLLASDEAPERILRGPPAAIDGRHPDLEPPATNLAMLCNYSVLTTTDSWQTLAKSPDRCGMPEVIATSEIELGETIQVPAGSDDEVVYARIEGLEGSLFQRVATTLYKAPEFYIDTDYGTYRLVPGTATGPLVMRVPAGVDPPAPFSFAPGTSRLRVWMKGPFGFVDSLQVMFYRLSISTGGAR